MVPLPLPYEAVPFLPLPFLGPPSFVMGSRLDCMGFASDDLSYLSSFLPLV